MASTRLPMLATLVACALGCAAHFDALPAAPGSAVLRAGVQRIRADLGDRWRCDVATRRALLADGDDEQHYAEVEESCPAAGDPPVPAE